MESGPQTILQGYWLASRNAKGTNPYTFDQALHRFLGHCLFIIKSLKLHKADEKV